MTPGEDSPSKWSAVRAGQMIGRYRIVRELGSGGMAVVYLADDATHHRQIALKVLRPELSGALGPERFLREIAIAAGLRHPHILPLYDSGESDGILYYVMPYVEGESLRSRLDREKQLPIEDALRVAREVTDALSYAHTHGVVHRDIKPENILLDSDHAVVADFGIARALSAAGTRLTGSGLAIGTPSYMSPEQAAGERDVDGRSDLYSLSCVLYEMLAGQAPFTGPTTESVIRQHLLAEPRSITLLRPAVTPDVAAAITRALAKAPADRFSRMEQFGEALMRPYAIRVEARDASAKPLAVEPRALAVDALGRMTGSSVRRWWLVGVAAALLVAAGSARLLARRHEPIVEQRAGSSATPLDQKYVVAVLPFQSMSRDSTKSYFAAGMTDEITGQLSQLSALRVLSPTALAPYHDASGRLQRLAKELGVGSVVEGSVQVEGNQARIRAQLTDALSGQAIWTEQYDRPTSDVFSAQTEIAHEIAGALQASLTPDEARRAGRPPTVNPAAYELYMQSAPSLKARVASLQRAIRLDSTFARAYSSLAYAYMFVGFGGDRVYMDSALEAAHRAVALDPDGAHGYYSLGTIESSMGHLEASRASLHKALELNPNLAAAMDNLSITEDYLGRYDESLHWAARALPLDPNNPNPYYHVGIPLLRLADDAATERFLAGPVRRFPDNVRLEMEVSLLELLRGHQAAAMQRARRMIARAPENPEAQFYLAEVAVITHAADAPALLAPLARQAPESRPLILPESFRALYAFTLSQAGEQTRAAAMWEDALAADRRDLKAENEAPDLRIEIAAISAARGDTASALEWLERGYQAGFKDYRLLACDPFFDRLRPVARFRQISARMQQDVAAMRRLASAEHDTLFALSPRR